MQTPPQEPQPIAKACRRQRMGSGSTGTVWGEKEPPDQLGAAPSSCGCRPGQRRCRRERKAAGRRAGGGWRRLTAHEPTARVGVQGCAQLGGQDGGARDGGARARAWAAACCPETPPLLSSDPEHGSVTTVKCRLAARMPHGSGAAVPKYPHTEGRTGISFPFSFTLQLWPFTDIKHVCTYTSFKLRDVTLIRISGYNTTLGTEGGLGSPLL